MSHATPGRKQIVKSPRFGDVFPFQAFMYETVTVKGPSEGMEK